jgi:tripartite-type tricarboxylate transporter receptor subunit TctC
MRRHILKVLGGATLACAVPFARGQGASYPAKTVRIVVPYPPGAITDIIPRMVAERLREAWGQPVIVENRPGGSGRVAASHVAGSAPDGYTILVGLPDQLAIAPSLFKTAGGFDPTRDFAPVTIMVRQAFVLVVREGLPVESVADYVKYARANPGALKLASWGEGSAGHVALELLKSMARIDVLHVPYRGAQAAINAVAGGEVDSMITGFSTATPFIKSGKIRLLGTTAATRLAERPEVPTVAEAGLPGYEVQTWYALVVPRATPREIVDVIRRDVATALQHPEIRERVRGYNAEMVSNTPEEFAAVLKADQDKWSRVIRDANIRLD